MKIKFFVSIILLISVLYCSAQSSRISDHNTIGWYNYFGTFRLASKFSIHSEYQWRRNDLVSKWQQSLFRAGINYQLNPKVQLRIGYALIETFSYGEIPVNSFGKDFTEHRVYQMFTLTDKISSIDFSHRFMLEQRWVGRYSNVSKLKEDEFPILNRLRYMIRAQFPLRGKEVKEKIAYIAIYDEIMIGFGQNVSENIFDQNRLGILLGYKFSPFVRVETGYINQILQLGREINNLNVIQYNNGLLVNTIFNFN